jgi:hypothetical protein
MCSDSARKLSFETMLTDPLIRLVMDADGVTLAELVAVMEVARAAQVARERLTLARSLQAASESAMMR